MRTELTIDGIKYIVSDRQKGGTQITRVAPYDETEYHWAVSNQLGNQWTVYRHSPGRKVCITSSNTPEEVAQKCLNLDRRDGLKRSGGIW